MFLKFRNLQRLGSHLVQRSGCLSISSNKELLKALDCCYFAGNQLNIHISPPFNAFNREGLSLKKVVKSKEVKHAGETIGIMHSTEDMFPTYDLMDREFDGMVFQSIPIVYINATRNNTKISLVVDSFTKLDGSAGKEGFKNAKKGTNLAGQAVGVAFGMRAVKQGYKTVRIMVCGLGPGRMSSIKGLQIGGLNIVSITDYTVTAKNERPRKQRKL